MSTQHFAQDPTAASGIAGQSYIPSQDLSQKGPFSQQPLVLNGSRLFKNSPGVSPILGPSSALQKKKANGLRNAQAGGFAPEVPPLGSCSKGPAYPRNRFRPWSTIANFFESAQDHSRDHNRISREYRPDRGSIAQITLPQSIPKATQPIPSAPEASGVALCIRYEDSKESAYLAHLNQMPPENSGSAQLVQESQVEATAAINYIAPSGDEKLQGTLKASRSDCAVHPRIQSSEIAQSAKPRTGGEAIQAERALYSGGMPSLNERIRLPLGSKRSLHRPTEYFLTLDQGQLKRQRLGLHASTDELRQKAPFTQDAFWKRPILEPIGNEPRSTMKLMVSIRISDETSTKLDSVKTKPSPFQTQEKTQLTSFEASEGQERMDWPVLNPGGHPAEKPILARLPQNPPPERDDYFGKSDQAEQYHAQIHRDTRLVKDIECDLLKSVAPPQTLVEVLSGVPLNQLSITGESVSYCIPNTLHYRIYRFRSLTTKRQQKIMACHHGACRKAFKKWHNFFDHLRSHTKEKPFRCPIEGCNSRFAQKTNQIKHLEQHGLPRKKVLKQMAEASTLS